MLLALNHSGCVFRFPALVRHSGRTAAFTSLQGEQMAKVTENSAQKGALRRGTAARPGFGAGSFRLVRGTAAVPKCHWRQTPEEPAASAWFPRARRLAQSITLLHPFEPVEAVGHPGRFRVQYLTVRRGADHADRRSITKPRLLISPQQSPALLKPQDPACLWPGNHGCAPFGFKADPFRKHH